MSTAADRLNQVLEQIANAELKAGRKAGSVSLLPVSKGKSAAEIAPFLALPNFPQVLGENYLNEIEEKSAGLRSHQLKWHFIGPLQSRKIKDISAVADMVHTVCREKELRVFAQLDGCPKFLIQVNVSGEAQKNGCEPKKLAKIIESCEKLELMDKLAGLMCLPSLETQISTTELAAQFALLRQLRDQHVPKGILSMGMSADLELAIAEGSDLVRVGTAIFGARQTEQKVFL